MHVFSLNRALVGLVLNIDAVYQYRRIQTRPQLPLLIVYSDLHIPDKASDVNVRNGFSKRHVDGCILDFVRALQVGENLLAIYD